MGREINRDDKIKAAWLFIGEGSVGIYPRKNGSYMRVSLKMCDINVMRWLQSLWPGAFYTRAYKNPRHRTGYAWSRTATQAEEFLRDISPYLIGEKVPQVYLALQFQSRRKPHTGRELRLEDRLWDESARQEMKRLKNKLPELVAV